MAPSAVPIEGVSHIDDEECGRTTKRIKLAATAVLIENDVEDGSITIPSHPLGIRPSGNAYTASHDIKTACGPFSRIPDELLITLLEGLDAQDLVRLGTTCKAFYAFTRLEELWRSLFIVSPPEDFTWNGTWRSTYLRLPASHTSPISCKNLYSDVLYRPFHCTYTPLAPYTTKIPSRNSIPRLPDLTPDEFSASWTDTPFILTSPVKEWPIYGTWTPDSLLATYPHVKITAEAVDWPLATYMSYMRHSSDESPLYLFDRAFASKLSITIGKDAPGAAYWPPTCFGSDLFSVLGDQRPDSRWLIMGPARSGSTFHKDPNATSAWNATLTGRKYWLLFPSSPTLPPPPGVILSEDQSEITAPLSIAEYLLSFHALARRTPGAREGICDAGEVLHVPSGWFHLVLNLDESLAVTQNFVPRKRVADVLGFLRDQGEQASGFRDEVTDPYGLFVERLGESAAEVLEEGMRELRKRDGVKKVARSEKWEALVKGNEDEEGCGFSFGFGGDDDEVVP